MTKKIRIQLPKDEMTIREIEVWLNEMAKEGFHLVRFRINKIIFVESEPQDIKYRIVPLDDLNTASKIRRFRDLGYERVATQRKKDNIDFTIGLISYFTFRSMNKNNVKDIEGDVIDENFIEDEFRYKKFISVGGIILYAIMAFIYMKLPQSSVQNIDLHSYFRLLPFVVVYIVLVCIAVAHLFNIIKKNKTSLKTLNLEPTIKVSTHKGYRKYHRLLLLFLPMFLTLPWLCSIIANSVSIGQGYLINQENIITLLDLEDLKVIDGIDNRKYVYGISKPTLLIRNHYYLNKELVLNEEKISDYRIKYYNFRISNIVPWVIEKWVDKNSITILEHSKPVYVSSNNFDTIVYLLDTDENVNEISLCFYNEKEFIDLWYKGSKTPQEIIVTVDRICSEQ